MRTGMGPICFALLIGCGGGAKKETTPVATQPAAEETLGTSADVTSICAAVERCAPMILMEEQPEAAQVEELRIRCEERLAGAPPERLKSVAGCVDSQGSCDGVEDCTTSDD